MENNNETQISSRAGNSVQYTEDSSTGLLGVFIFFIVMFVMMLVIAHFFG